MTAVSLTAPAASAGTVIGGYAYTGKLWKADPLPALPQVSSGNASGLARVAAAATAKGSRELRTHQAAAPSWPAGSEGVLDVGRAANVGPVRVTAAPEGASARTAKAPASVKVETADRAGAQAANVDGLLVGLESADGSASGGAVSVAVDYGSIAQAYGGGWASRLHLVQMPACALTTPQYASCRTQQPLETVNDPVTHQLTATVQLPARDTSSGALKLDAVTGSGTAVAAVSDTGGSQGSYTATSLSASGSWTQSASGAFTYSYPIALPASLGGSAPRWRCRTTRSRWTGRPRPATRRRPGSATAGTTRRASSSAPTGPATPTGSPTPATSAGTATTRRCRSVRAPAS
ncbi:hypothetical protein ACFQ2M_17075 [Kitasatospora saccharophila]|uniref:hypothetical protein n=1 Tax=Kitasatospora saccharophila TaxID=407973 RepID=UPI00362F8F82